MNLKQQNIDLKNNNLTGSIPSEIGSITKLSYLRLSFNELAGSIPAEIGNLTQLTVLVLGQNDLSGTLENPIFGELINAKGEDPDGLQKNNFNSDLFKKIFEMSKKKSISHSVSFF